MNDSEISYSNLGRYTYIANHTIIRFASIGAFCSIGDNVRTCLGRHPTNWFSSHPQTYSRSPPSRKPWVIESKFEEHLFTGSNQKYVVEIGHDVWIGNNVLIMDGVSVGDGAIVGAGSVVTADIEAYSICGGVPARKIRSRFSEEEIREMKSLRWWERSDSWIKEHMIED